MPFISCIFAGFFIAFAVLFHASVKCGRKALPVQQLLLLAASLTFYAAADLRSLPFLLYIIVVSYGAGWFSRNRVLLALFIISELLPLLFFKYSPKDWRGSLLFPLGLSFFTFQGISYAADCYTGKITAERKILPVALFVSFFPVISSGPIQRAGKLIPQLKTIHHFDYDTATDGMKLFAWGMFKKLCVADRLAVYVNAVYGTVNESQGVALFLATVLYAFQIYCDFSGYSDMAVGIARFMGFDVGRNFDHPYLSQSVGEFWRRWHISLSSWLRDYVYIPLGGSRVVLPRIYLNLMVTFLVSGLWHGAGWHFMLWGLLHGFYLCVERLLKPCLQKVRIPAAMSIAVSFCLVSFAWIFFRAGNMAECMLIIKKLAGIPMELVQMLHSGGIADAVRNALSLSAFGNGLELIQTAGLFAVLLCVEVLTRNTDGLEILRTKKTVVRWILYAACIAVLVHVLPLDLSFKELNSYSTNFIYQNF